MNRQGSEGGVDPETGRRLPEREVETQVFLREVYEERIDLGVARELAGKPERLGLEIPWKAEE